MTLLAACRIPRPDLQERLACLAGFQGSLFTLSRKLIPLKLMCRNLNNCPGVSWANKMGGGQAYRRMAQKIYTHVWTLSAAEVRIQFLGFKHCEVSTFQEACHTFKKAHFDSTGSKKKSIWTRSSRRTKWNKFFQVVDVLHVNKDGRKSFLFHETGEYKWGHSWVLVFFSSAARKGQQRQFKVHFWRYTVKGCPTFVAYHDRSSNGIMPPRQLGILDILEIISRYICTPH